MKKTPLDIKLERLQKAAEALSKPYVSEAQRRWAHTDAGKKALGGKDAVHHWDEETKGKKLPEKVKKDDMPPPPPPSSAGMSAGDLGDVATAGGTTTIGAQIGNPFGKSKEPFKEPKVGELFKSKPTHSHVGTCLDIGRKGTHLNRICSASDWDRMTTEESKPISHGEFITATNDKKIASKAIRFGKHPEHGFVWAEVNHPDKKGTIHHYYFKE